MSPLIDWFKKKNFKAHFTVGALVTVAGIVKYDADVQLLLLKFCKAHPEFGSTLILIAGIIFRYSQANKPAPPPTQPPTP